ncbi:MAG: putative transcriptional regulator [Candidatus Accumulibacter adjunctus]|uniref:Transcriptional regulator n=1 Tax=Candidatus Accumulibacter adjunctus TaxID=1454001 RepID=A0A011NMJ3_9PROT|nr:MAG: putative transcriptional regulator [Candidatus Accumulibacter adjunctus]
MKAIIEISARNSIFDTAIADIATGGSADFHLSFESARQLFAEITPVRLDLLDTLRKNGPCSIYALAKTVARNYSNVHTDIARLIDLGLVEQTDGDMVHVPFDDIEVHFRLAHAA